MTFFNLSHFTDKKGKKKMAFKDYSSKEILVSRLAGTDYEGWWGKPTSTLDWCERNYEVRTEKKFNAR